jgi:hypothetical protein
LGFIEAANARSYGAIDSGELAKQATIVRVLGGDFYSQAIFSLGVTWKAKPEVKFYAYESINFGIGLCKSFQPDSNGLAKAGSSTIR